MQITISLTGSASLIILQSGVLQNLHLWLGIEPSTLDFSILFGALYLSAMETPNAVKVLI